ncbi:nuclear transport factor 2 family protein [Sphingomonas sp. SRS2]|uniref:nuclear transport factor 2 family protein n=1 Tax=Sphingomonas sp. SRS2 TaxID=133190 RepID=UPI0006184C5C|nr:nuclear transport factor 2 family protein [Sphingomonas sp. SRS2]
MDEDRLERMEKEIRELRDQLELRELLSRYGFTADLGHEQEFSELWTQDGEYDLDDLQLRGREQLHHLVSDPQGLHKQVVENRSMHIPTNIFIRVDGDSAWAEAYSMIVIREDDGRYAVFTAGYNHFDFKRVNGGWLISRRHRRAIGGPKWGGSVISAHLQT